MSLKALTVNRDYWIFIVFCLKAIALYYATIASPGEQTLGSLIGLFYIHTPVAWITYLALGASAIFTAIFLFKKDLKYDALAENSAIIGVFYGAAAILTGAIWANAVWGSYWNWDPRETTTLISELAYLGYIVLRLSIPSVERKAVSSGIYNILAFSTVPLSYLSVHALLSLHPIIVTPTEFRVSTAIFQTLALSVIAETALYIFLMRCLYLTTHIDRATHRLQEAGD